MKKLKRLSAIILVATMVFCLLPTAAMAATASEVYVGGLQIPDDNTAHTITGTGNSGTATFNNGVLTLNGVTATAASSHSNAAIYANGDLVIELIGTNTVTGPDGSGVGIHIASGSLTVQRTSGTGTLTANGGSVSASGNSSYGVYVVGGSLTVSSGTLTANGGDGADAADTLSYGVQCSGNVVVSGGTLIANGGSSVTDSYGVESLGNVSVSSGTLTAGSNAASSQSYGVYANGTCTFTGGNITASCDSSTTTKGAFNKQPVYGSSDTTWYMWRVSNSGNYTSSGATPYTLAAGNTYVEMKSDVNISSVSLSTDAPAVGTAITATLVPSGATVTYQWYTNTSAAITGGTAISSATSSSYTPVAADVGKYIYVVVTGSGNSTGTASDVTAAAVTAAANTALTGVTLSTNTPAVGTAITTTLAPAGSTATYQWYTNTSAATTGGTAISSATSASYTPVAADVGKYIYVTATGSGSSTGSASAVTTGAVTAAATSTLTGVTLSSNTPVVGTAITTTLAPAGATATYQWYTNTSSATTGGTAISSATSASYTPVTADVGKYIYVTATGSGSSTGSASAVTTGVVTATATTPMTGVTLSTNTPSVGTAITVTLAPKEATVSYQWQVAGADISGATSSSYTPVNADYGKAITVVVTGTGSFSGSVSATTTGTVKLKAVLTPKTSFNKGSAPTNMKFTIGEGIAAADLGKASFSALKMDGVAVTAGTDTYSVADGSLVISFAQSYLNGLAVGKHTVDVTVTGTYAGTYSTTITVAAASTPATGDNSQIFIWISLVLFAAGAIVVTVLTMKKRSAK